MYLNTENVPREPNVFEQEAKSEMRQPGRPLAPGPKETHTSQTLHQYRGKSRTTSALSTKIVMTTAGTGAAGSQAEATAAADKEPPTMVGDEGAAPVAGSFAALSRKAKEQEGHDPGPACSNDCS